jgi:hypothetical protein
MSKDLRCRFFLSFARAAQVDENHTVFNAGWENRNAARLGR